MKDENAEWIRSYAEASRQDFSPNFNIVDALDEIATKFETAAQDEAGRLVAEALTDALDGMFIMEGINAAGHFMFSVCAGDAYRKDFDIEEFLVSLLNQEPWDKADCTALAASLRRIADLAEKKSGE